MVKEALNHRENLLQKSMSSDASTHNYEEAVQTLNSLQTNASVLQQAKRRIGQPNTNVEETRKFLQRSGVSQEMLDSSLSIIHVAGTKGKGSTCAFTESILRQHGMKTGFFSSPHLVEVRERIRINGEPISRDLFTMHFWDVYRKLRAYREFDSDMPPYFKFLTVMAFNVFIREKVDVAIIEVGIGGELDCTNVIRRPVAVGITSLGLDHVSLLGHTVELIAGQKAGIMKPAAPAFTVTGQPGHSLDILRERAAQTGCPLTVCPPLSDFTWPDTESRQLGLESSVQELNASLAVHLAHTWLANRSSGDKDVSLDPTLLDVRTARGLRLASWPGRAHVEVRGGVAFFLDGAHTADSVSNCLHWFIGASRRMHPGARHVLVFNSTGEREPASLLQPLWDARTFKHVAFCPNIASENLGQSSDQSNLMVTTEQQLLRSSSHSVAWSQLSALHSPSPLTQTCSPPGGEVRVFPSVQDTLAWLDSVRSEEPLHVLVTGSLHLVGCVLGQLGPTESESQSASSEQLLSTNQKIAALPLVGKVR